jgi:lipoprotein-releasing system ATP-binding protein
MGINMENIVLSCKNIYKSYLQKNEKISVLKDISLDFKKEKIYILVGASGAGKSTLLHILGTIDKPDSGIIYFNNENISQLSDAKLNIFRNKHIGFIFQFHHLLPEFTSVENVAIPHMIMGEKPKVAFEKAKELLNELNLSHRFNNKPNELSGGEQQRVAIARAIINEPDIILADEPTGNLDSKNAEIINNLFIALNQKKKITLIIATHNPELMNIGHSVIEIKDGCINNIIYQ